MKSQCSWADQRRYYSIRALKRYNLVRSKSMYISSSVLRNVAKLFTSSARVSHYTWRHHTIADTRARWAQAHVQMSTSCMSGRRRAGDARRTQEHTFVTVRSLLGGQRTRQCFYCSHCCPDSQAKDDGEKYMQYRQAIACSQAKSKSKRVQSNTAWSFTARQSTDKQRTVLVAKLNWMT